MAACRSEAFLKGAGGGRFPAGDSENTTLPLYSHSLRCDTRPPPRQQPSLLIIRVDRVARRYKADTLGEVIGANDKDFPSSGEVGGGCARMEQHLNISPAQPLQRCP
ncbi:unnamed protein product [Merluccius merluccius]